MKEEKQEGERMRRSYAPRGQRSQMMLSFRCDSENVEWLQQQPNKGRYLNNLIRADMEQRSSEP